MCEKVSFTMIDNRGTVIFHAKLIEKTIVIVGSLVDPSLNETVIPLFFA